MMLLLKYTLMYAVVLMLVALGGMFSEHSGIINIALEGIMVIGGLVGVLMIRLLPPAIPAWLLVTLSILGAAVFGASGEPASVSAVSAASARRFLSAFT